MLENFLTAAQQVLILFVLMAVGAVGRKARLIDGAAMPSIVNILLLLVTPCLIIDSFQRPFNPTQGGNLAVAFGASLSVHIIAIALAHFLVRHNSEGTRKVLHSAVVFANAGFMGIPLEQAILGDDGVFYGIVYVVAFNLVIWSWGYWEMGGKPRLRQLLINPGTVGIALGLPFFFLSLKLPPFLSMPVKMMSSLNTPLAMIVIGYGLAGAKLGQVVRMPAAYLSAFMRLMVVPLLLVLFLLPFKHHLASPMMIAVVTASSTPVAAMVSMFATRFKRDEDTSVGLVCGTTLISAFTMPLVIAIAMKVL